MPRFILGTHKARLRERAGSLTVAVSLTTGLALVSMRGAPSLVRLLAGGDTLDVPRMEELRYMVVVPPDDTRVAGAAAVSRNVRGVVRVDAPTSQVMPLSATASSSGTAASERDRDPRPYIPWTPAPGRSYRNGRTTAPSLGRFLGTQNATAEQMDSVLWKLERSVPYHPYVPPTLAERDAMLRDQAKQWAIARDLQRPVPVSAVWGLFMPGVGKRKLEDSRSASGPVGGGVGLPLFSPGPSSTQRRSESAIHAGNLLRLQRLADMAKARQDSLRRMDSIAMLGRP